MAMLDFKTCTVCGEHGQHINNQHVGCKKFHEKYPKPRTKVDHWVKRFMGMAQLVSTWSKDPSTQCGCVIVRPDRTVCSVGFNGFPRNMPDDTDLYLDKEYKHSAVVHSEMNAILTAHEPVVGYTLYNFPVIPCDRCAVMLIQAGIKRVVAPKTSGTPNMGNQPYTWATSHFKAAGVELIQLI